MPATEKIRDAIDSLKEIVSLTDDKETLQETHFMIGECYQKLGENGQARNAYQDAIDIDSNTEWARKAKREMKNL